MQLDTNKLGPTEIVCSGPTSRLGRNACQDQAGLTRTLPPELHHLWRHPASTAGKADSPPPGRTRERVTTGTRSVCLHNRGTALARGLAYCCAGILLLVGARVGLAQAGDGFLITEFMAANSATIEDEDGNDSDWIEIYNEAKATNNLGGWYLTDRSNDLRQWQFPATNIPPGGYIVV